MRNLLVVPLVGLLVVGLSVLAKRLPTASKSRAAHLLPAMRQGCWQAAGGTVDGVSDA